MSYDNHENDRYSFRIEGMDAPQAPERGVPQSYNAQSMEHYRENAGQPAQDHRYIKKMMTRAIALSVVLALLLGSGLGILLNEFVFSNRNADTAQVEDRSIADAAESVQSDDGTAAEPADRKNDGGALNANRKNAGNLLFTESSNRSEMSVADVVSAVEDSVVAITVEIENTATYFYQNIKYKTNAKGSGVIVSPDGYIVTNNHVVADATKVSVTLANGDTYDATVIGADDFTDLGLIKIEANGLTAAQFGSSEELRKGDTAIIIGNPLGYLDGSVSTGIISAMGRTLEFSDGTILHNLIQTDAAVNPGNSGGGLFDARGALVGVVCAKTSASDVEGLGFAIPVSTVRTVIQDLKDYGYVKGRPALGVNAMEVTDAYTAMYNHLPRLGVYVTGFINNEAAEGSELQIGDCIVSIDDVEVSTTSEILAALYPYQVGDRIEIVVLRNNEVITVSTTLVEQDNNY